MIVIQIAGHLGQDPETRFTATNKKVTTFRVATNIKRGTKEKTVWWRVTVWGDRFDQKLQYLKKGSAVIVIGEMGIPEIYTDKDGNPQTSFEITADSIIFNPFGSKSSERKPESESVGEEAEDYVGAGRRQEKEAMSFKKSTMSQGGASSPSSFDAEDDLPF